LGNSSRKESILRNCGSVDVAEILKAFKPDIKIEKVERIGTGHINQTYKVLGSKSFILQRINNQVFVKPESIERNVQLAKEYLSQHHPSYLFLAPLPAANGRHMVYDQHGFPWRLYPYIENSHTIDQARTTDEAFKAAQEFGRLGSKLQGCDPMLFEDTIPRFHDLALRYKQFEDALLKATPTSINEAGDAIQQAQNFSFLTDQYKSLIAKGILIPRVFHNDTKVNNVLFDSMSGNTLAVIDLDTMMSGYFIYDLGDLLRTLVSPVSEEEKDLNKVSFREDFYRAVVDGYLGETNDCLTIEEKKYVSFAGPMMTYIMALRFLADYLRGNTYYHITYPEQNLVRSRNQLKLVDLFLSNTSSAG
jgi:Ser/Thr protein kinase RdoA (MazF antagonist)